MKILIQKTGYIIYDEKEKYFYDKYSEQWEDNFNLDCVYDSDLECLEDIENNEHENFEDIEDVYVKRIIYEINELSSKKVKRGSAYLEE